MRMFAQDKSFCRTLRVDETACPVAPERLRIAGRIARWDLATGRIKPGAFRREGRVQAKRWRRFASGGTERWRAADKHLGVQVGCMILSIRAAAADLRRAFGWRRVG